jgi:RNA polymerase sigma factor (sigma-70 family)
VSSSKAETREQVLTQVIKDHRGRLSSTIIKSVRDQGEAEDVLQDVFAEFVEAYDLGEVIETLGAWLMRVAQNKVLDRFRRKKTQSDYQVQALAAADQDEGKMPGNEWMQDVIRSEILDALETLPAEQRDVFVKHELEGKSFEEIAAETGAKVNTLLSRKRYAVTALRTYLKETYDELE